MISSQSRRSAPTVRRKRSAWAFACGARIGVWIKLDRVAAEDLVEACGQLAVAVGDRKPRPLEDAAEGELARLLCQPGTARVVVQAARWTRRLASSIKKSS